VTARQEEGGGVARVWVSPMSPERSDVGGS
jgi:hypothetical protein